MVERPDAVLAAIPVLSVGGVVLGRLARMADSAGVGSLPFVLAGLAAALLVIGHELFVAGPGTRS